MYKEDQFKDIGFLPIYSAMFKLGEWLGSWEDNKDLIIGVRRNQFIVFPNSPHINFPEHSWIGDEHFIREKIKEYYEKRRNSTISH